MSEQKVYCESCKYCEEWELNYSKCRLTQYPSLAQYVSVGCKKNPTVTIIETPLGQVINIDYSNCLVKNKDLNCKDYKFSFWKKFINWLFKWR